ncbi:MAG: glycosyltransferase family 9 protein [Planctomycetota bacterium]
MVHPLRCLGRRVTAAEGSSHTPPRILVVCPSWVGDAVMATPALRRLRSALPGAYIGALCKPGIEQILGGDPKGRTRLIDEFHVDPRAGVMGPKRAASKIRGRRYTVALLLSNSFSAALAVRMGGVPERLGYDRDGRSLLLTSRIAPPKNDDGSWAIVCAVEYYHTLTDQLISSLGKQPPTERPPLELHTTYQEDTATEQLLERSSITDSARLAILNPGGNNPAKRWPADRFAALADHLATEHGLTILLNGAPSEGDLIAAIDECCECACVRLPELGMSLGMLKPICKRASLMVTNDTGPRHIAAAFGTPVVSLFGPTDHRWTTIPTKPLPNGEPAEQIILADPTLPESESANDHPERCRIERIELETVTRAADELLQEMRP